MAVVDRNSDVIANMVATPAVFNDPHTHGLVREALGICTPAADDTQASVHRFVRIPTNARITDVLIAAADASSAGKYDFGFYYPADVNAGAVIDADALADAFDLSGGPFYWSEVRTVSIVTIAESEKPAWELAGLSADPGGYFDIAGTIDTTFNGGPTTVGLKVRYVI